MAGNDGHAAIFLQKKANKAQELTALQQAYDLAAANSCENASDV